MGAPAFSYKISYIFLILLFILGPVAAIANLPDYRIAFHPRHDPPFGIRFKGGLPVAR